MTFLRYASAAIAVASTLLLCAPTRAHADIHDTPGERSLALAAGPSLVIPREDWSINGERFESDGSILYNLYSTAQKMNLMVWINKATRCASADACLQQLLKSNTNRPEISAVKSVDKGPFKASTYRIDYPTRNLAQFTLIAVAVVDGVLLEVHASQTPNEKPDAAPLVAFLGRLRVR